MEELIQLIIILAIIGSTIWKMIKSSQSEKTEKLSVIDKLKKAFDEMARSIQTELETRAGEASPGTDAWERLLAGPASEDEPEKTAPPPLPAPSGKPEIKEKKGLAPPLPKPADKVSQPEAEMHPGIMATAKKQPVGYLGKTDLQRAVIWSEILGPPVGLRENVFEK